MKLDRIWEEIRAIHKRLDEIMSMMRTWHPLPIHISEMRLLQLPDNLRKTYLVVAEQGECDATGVSAVTGRSRAIESSYLNQLVRMGWLKKRRNKKRLLFRVAGQ